MTGSIYLDFNASTPVAPEVAAAMAPILERFGNPTSDHWAGLALRTAIVQARGRVADLLGCDPEEVVFTSGGTEANNWALKGVFYATDGPCHIITSGVEHPAIVEPCRFLQRLGARVTIVGVDGTGMVDPEDIQRAIGPDTRLISIMHANNEVGTIQPIAEISRIARARGVLMHTDAAQSVGKIDASVDALGVDLLSVAGHKLYAPIGIGALFVRAGVTLESFVHGAGHERGRRAGTENVLEIVGLGAACALAEPWIDSAEIRRLRDELWDRIHNRLPHAVLNGHPTKRLPNTLNVSIPGIAGSEILARMEGVAASTGSACHSGAVTLSPVLRAMGVSPEVGMGALRFSLGRSTTKMEIAEVAERLGRAVAQLDAGQLVRGTPGAGADGTVGSDR